MKTNLILTISILAIFFTACSSSSKDKDDEIGLIQQQIILPSGESGHLTVMLSKEDSSYIIHFDSDDKTSLIRIIQTTNFYTQYYSHCDDSIVVNSRETSSQKKISLIIAEPSGDRWKPLRYHTTVDMLAKTYLSNDKFERIAKVEFFPDNYFSPTKIEKIVLWESTRIYVDNKMKILKK